MSLHRALLEAAENANTYQPLGPHDQRIEADGYVLWMGPGAAPGWNVVQRLRLTEQSVEPTLEEVHGLLRKRDRTACTWEIGNSATPADLVERLLEHGLVPDTEPFAVGMVLTAAPEPGPPDVRARKVKTFEEYAAAQEVARQAFAMSAAEAAEYRELDEARWRDHDPAQGATFGAWVDGALVGMATAAYLDCGLQLNAGSVVPHARGRGAYRALVAARWADAVARGTPALVTQAGAMSRPILARLGFEAVAEIHILLDRFGP